MRFKRAAEVILFSMVLILSFSGAVLSQEEGWNSFRGRYCTVLYEEGVNLRYVSRRINLRFANFYNPGRHRNSGLSDSDVLGEKLDAIFSKVEDILEMYPSNISVTLKIFKHKHGLDAEYERIFDEPNRADSFYIYKYNTIYAAERYIREGILAHEMAHCIIDHYFVILPPRKVQEMLAVYADVHLKD